MMIDSDFTIRGWIYGYLYGMMMKVAHRYNWHYAPPIYPDGDTQLWCKWCGFRETIIKTKPMPANNEPAQAI